MIYLIPIGGLCNRLRGIGSAIKFGKEQNDSVTVLWRKNEEAGCVFDDLFNRIPNDVGGVDIQNTACSEKELLVVMAKKIGQERCYTSGTEFVEHYVTQNGQGDFLLSTCYSFGDFDNSFDWLSPKEELNKKIHCIVGKFGDNVIGIHIRRTDHRKAIKYSPVAVFQEAVDKEIIKDDAVKFYLATDDMEVKKLFEEKYGRRIVTNGSYSVTRKTKEGMEDAVIDLFALANTRKIYGSYTSSFSEMAAYNWESRTKDIIKLGCI